ncbi:MAG: CusA/CzcA family heavy metal efflux RND transporter [Candidatus Melainabacteria bacterium]|nr:MAG: CusA/CzcA family heavy metal efflux RND transporter [Candidatus Melainabacteria bacterium]
MLLGILKKRNIVVFVALCILFFGYKCHENLALEAYPDIANMQVRVITQVPGKAAEEMERLVTIPLEKELNGIPHAEPPRSISIFGLSVITVTFDDEIPSNVARHWVLEKINSADLPQNVQPQLDPDASPVGEVYRYTVEGSDYTPRQKKEWEDWYLERKFKAVHGVVDSTGFGGPTKVYLVELDPNMMKALNISLSQVETAISSSNGSTGGSYIVRNGQNYMVRGIGLLRSVEDIENVVLASEKEGPPILVKNIANVSVSDKVRLGQVGKNEDDDVVEGIVLMRRGENPSRAVDNIMAAWNDIQAGLPHGMRLAPLYDRTALVRKTSETIGHNVAEGIVLVVVILMLYLFQVRSALIAAVSIPMSLCTAMILLYVFDIPANLLSLGAIDFGIIVDASIIMVENIIRHLSEMGAHTDADKRDVLYTIYSAANEVTRPILFATSIIVLTFLPVFTFERVEGKLFRPLAVNMNFYLLGGVLSAMTLVPVLCAIVYAKTVPSEKESPIMAFFLNLYKPILTWSMKNKFLVALIGIGAVCFSVLGAATLGGEFLPPLEEGNIWVRATVLPTSVSLQQSVKIAGGIRRVFRTYPEVANVVSQIGAPDDGTDPNNYSNIEIFVDLKPREEWRPQFRDKQELIADMNNKLMDEYPGCLYNFSQYIKDNMDEAIAGVKGELGIKIYGQDLDILDNIGSQIRNIIQNIPGMVDVAKDELLGQPQLLISIDRANAARYGINTSDILDTVQTSIGGMKITELQENDRRFGVMVRYQAAYRKDIGNLENILLTTPNGSRIPLSSLAKIEEAHGATAILRDKNSRRLAVKANIRGRDLLSTVLEAQKQISKHVVIPQGYTVKWEGQFASAERAMGRLLIIIPATLLLIFLLLYADFGSARIALLVMLTVPLATPGAILALMITHTHFSISAGVGFIALSGVAVQNGVILVSLVEHIKGVGVSLRQAVAQSALIRMKPALMTTTVAAAGLLPAAMSTAIGAQSQRPLALVIVGGLIPGVMLALIVLPALYEFFDSGFKLTSKKEPIESELESSKI